jgi:hypothetical protein
MGKREFLLIAGFVALGIVVYALTAPPRPEGDRDFSLHDWIAEMRTEIAGGMRAPLDRRATAPADRGIRRVRLPAFRGAVSITGVDGNEVGAHLSGQIVASTAERASSESLGTVLALQRAGDAIETRIELPRGRRPADMKIAIRVPRALNVEVEASDGPIEIGHIAGVRLLTRRADVLLHDVGEVRGEHRDGELDLRSAAAVNLILRGVDARMITIAGEARLDSADGDLIVQGLAGPLRLEGRRLDAELADLKGPADIVNADGSVEIAALEHPVRIEGRRTDVTIAMNVPAPVDVTTTDEAIELALPENGGATIDALATDGRVHVEGLPITVTGDTREQRARGVVSGGGPEIVLRVSRGVITVTK